MGLTLKERSERSYVVYFLRCPVTFDVRYIGISSNTESRFAYHNQTGEEPKGSWVKWLRDKGLKPIMEVKTLPMCRDAAEGVEATLTFMFERLHPQQLLVRQVPRLRVKRVSVLHFEWVYHKTHKRTFSPTHPGATR